MEQDEVINGSINFSALSGRERDGIFRSQIDTTFNLTAFGLTTETSVKQNGSKIAKLTDKIRRDVKELGLLCAASDKEKLLNVLIINQQLNIIDPPEVVQLVSDNATEQRTIKTILKPPPMPQRVRPKCKRNLKISYGVVTSDEVNKEIEEREIADAEQEIEREQDEIAKHEREKNIKEVDEQLREIRKKLITLRSENASKNKKSAQKKKSKNKEDENSKREQEIKENDDQLHELRDQ